MKKRIAKIAAILACAVLMTACGDVSGGTSTTTSEKTSSVSGKEASSAISQEFAPIVEHEGTPIDGGTLKVAIVSDSNFKGVFNGFLYTDAYDLDIMRNTMLGAFQTDGDFKLVLDSDETPIKVSVDIEAKTVTYKINPKFKWSNGDTVTTADIVKTYEIVANQAYIDSSQSVRYDDTMKNIVGIDEYNKGEAETISGLEVVDDATLVIHLKELSPSIYWGGGFAGEFVNAKQFEGVAMDKVIESDALRKNPLSYGPYVIKEIVAGEKVIFEANPHYIYGEAKVKNVEIELLPPSQQVAAIKSGHYDLVYSTSADVFPELKELDNISLATKMDLYMSYMGFKLGTWDGENNVVVTNPEAKMSDVSLRQAMGHAIDNDTLGDKFYHGLRFRAASPIAPLFATLHDENVTGYEYDLEKANALLDEAGFKDVDGDGIREDKNGQPLVINLAMMSGSEIQEPLSQYYIQQWASIGLKVELVDGKLLEFQSFYDRLQNDDPAIDVYMAAFGLGSDPNQGDLYGKGAPFNMPRYTSDKLQAATEALGSEAALDPEKQAELYHAFEAVAMEEVPIIPQMNRVTVLPVNKRVKMYDWSWYSPGNFGWHLIELTADAPVASTK